MGPQRSWGGVFVLCRRRAPRKNEALQPKAGAREGPECPHPTGALGARSAFWDGNKLVQGAVREVLEAIYEQDFLDCSHGFRPKRSAHDAIRALDRIAHRGKVGWILEADISSFFDSLDRAKLKELLQIRVADGSLLRLIGKCLHVGVLDGAEYAEPDSGTAQGSVLSPLLGNVYLHYVLDLWFEREVKPRLRGEAHLVRYADDFVITFERQNDAERVMDVLGKRMGRFGLTLHPDKTRLLPFRRPPAGQTGGKGPATFDFLGFTLHWRRARSGRWGMMCKTRSARLRQRDQGHRRLVSSPSTPASARCSTPRSRGAYRATSTTSASAATSVVCCCSSKRRSEPGTNGCAVAVNTRTSPGKGIASYWRAFPFRGPASQSESGGHSHEPAQRKSRMVEISLSGSGEGPGRAISRGYSTRPCVKIGRAVG